MTTAQRIHMFTEPVAEYRAVTYFPVCEMIYGIAERKVDAQEKAAELLAYFTRRER